MSREDKRRQPHPRTNNRFKIAGGGSIAVDAIMAELAPLAVLQDRDNLRGDWEMRAKLTKIAAVAACASLGISFAILNVNADSPKRVAQDVAQNNAEGVNKVWEGTPTVGTRANPKFPDDSVASGSSAMGLTR